MKKFLLISLGLFFCSCNQDFVFDEYKDFTHQSWDSDDVLLFEYFVQDTTMLYTTLIKVRHTVDYEYQNLFLFVFDETEKDTIELFLSDKKGEWLGRGVGDIREVKMLISSKKAKKSKKRNLIRIEQAMRYGAEEKIKKLKNIDALGITILPDNE